MSIRIPRGTEYDSVDTQAAFRDIEQQLEELKRGNAPVSTTTGADPELLARIERLEGLLHFNSDKHTFVGSGPQSSAGLVPSPGVTADSESVLLENGSWGYPVRGLVRAVTTLGAVGDQQAGSDVVDVLGNLAVLGDISGTIGNFSDLNVPGRPSARVTRSASQAISSGGSPTNIAFTVAKHNVGALWVSTDNTKITTNSAGLWLVGAHFLYDVSGAGTYRQSKLKASGTVISPAHKAPYASDSLTMTHTFLGYFPAGTYFQVDFVHDKGSDLNISYNDDFSPMMWAVRLG